MSAFILDKLLEIQEKNAYPLHMPGHKRNTDFMPYDFRTMDITETGDVDNLHDPKEIIAMSQKAMAELLGAEESFYLVNGGSSGTIAALLGCCNPGDTVLVASNCHKSVYHALVLSGVNPVYISPQMTEESLCGGISIRDMFRAFDDYDIKAMIITSPTYEGFTCDVKTIADIVHKHNSILIADECHGAHFVFSDKFPHSALHDGADVVVNSWHKTLPCLNQAAVLSINTTRVNKNRIKEAVSMMNTTSPSYPILASIDYARHILTTDKNLFTKYIETLTEARHELDHCKVLKLVNDSIKGQSDIFDLDISKFTIMVRTDMTGRELADLLLDKYNIQIEMAGPHHIIAMTSVADDPRGIKKFVKAIRDIDKKVERKYIEKLPLTMSPVQKPVMIPRDVYYAEKEEIDLDHSIGRIPSGIIMPYPPGIPLVAVGEKITSEHIEKIRILQQLNVNIIGVNNNKVYVVKNN
ncbi:MAG: aminotransferase class I/II-fold pyridoxal phosphate-dependent enzyme [Clostridia bacterium]|nr:aminotransferase class I/II-fold pyridoxal phosphate-dependent enzyme [Clostridia bacterium]